MNKPTPKQLAYLKSLAAKTATTFASNARRAARPAD